MKIYFQRIFLFFIIFLFPLVGSSLTFSLPAEDDDVIGYIQTAIVRRGETVGGIVRKYHVGFLELLEANPQVNFNRLRSGTKLIIPTRYILPQAFREGIIINLAELRLYYFPPNRSVVITFPIGIGREGEETPVVKTRIIEKRENPTWYPTQDTREKELLRGVILPPFIEPGPLNPLGDYAMRLAVRKYLIHGTNDPGGVGLRISGGCIRMYPEDIEQLYAMAGIGTSVNIVNQPIKLGWEDGTLYAEAHVPTHKKYGREEETLRPMSKMLMSEIRGFNVEIDWNRALAVAEQQQGIPIDVGRMIY